VEVLVNNAGAIAGGGIEEVDEERWREGWGLKVFGYVNMTRALHRETKARGRGVVVNVIGTAATRGRRTTRPVSRPMRPSRRSRGRSAGRASTTAFGSSGSARAT
jgi:NAD(P)-dependent dehydrogenase (short-subunit alcohol dehydrogenase family)